MAQRLMHFAISKELIKNIQMKNEYRFILGSIIPDCHNKSPEERNKTHYMKIDGKNKVVNFTKFFSDYKNEILTDDLYLGYYLHLVEDCLYRKFFYKEKNLYKKRTEPNFRENLYSDYHNLNYLLKEKYNLENIEVNVNEVPNHLGLTGIDELQKELNLDFSDKKISDLYYLSEDFINGFFNYIVDILLKEINSIKNTGKSVLNSENYWY